MLQIWKTLAHSENLLVIPIVCPMVQNKQTPNSKDKQTFTCIQTASFELWESVKHSVGAGMSCVQKRRIRVWGKQSVTGNQHALGTVCQQVAGFFPVY